VDHGTKLAVHAVSFLLMHDEETNETI
jgi:hypothetical protein